MIDFRKYGGTELVVGDLATSLAKFDEIEEVAVACCKGSVFPENLPKLKVIETLEESEDMHHDWVAREAEAYRIYEKYLDDYEVIIDNTKFDPIYDYGMAHPGANIFHVFHAPCEWTRSMRIPDNSHFIAASRAHAMSVSNYLGRPCKCIPHGINTDLYPFKSEKGGSYMFANRICREKGCLEFVQLMKDSGACADVCGEDRFVISQEYVENVKSRCNDTQVRYHGTVSYKEKIEFLQNAKAVISLPMYPFMEIFGLHAAEAMCCGTPVIALRSGGLTDQIVDGVTGFLCDALDEMQEIIVADKVSEIDPYECRRRVEKHFSREIMAKRYLKYFKTVLKG
ncbi:MAG: glycosyltransferase [Euryarchaeota archaeon]|nr:glycosyltransferase [Euryarchaeota archaeon]